MGYYGPGEEGRAAQGGGSDYERELMKWRGGGGRELGLEGRGIVDGKV